MSESARAYEQPIEFRVGASPADGKAAASERPIPLGSPQRASALDTHTREGVGGSQAADERAMLLFSFVSEVSLQDTDLNNLAQNQVQRIQTASTRATQEERRATPQPAQAAFLASGSRGHAERRPAARRDARSGALLSRADHTSDVESPAPMTADAAPAADGPRHEPRTEAAATPEARALSRGIVAGQGTRASTAARVAFARPNVDRGPAATPAHLLDSKIRDNRDAELLAAELQRSIVDASAQRARHKAPGEGGFGPGAGLDDQGLHQGARAVAYAPGAGAHGALDTGDARYVRWFVEQKQRVQNEVVFPKPRALAKDQGISIYRVVVRRDGGLAQGPRLVRSSGFADFDAAAVLAIRRAAPFSPLPSQLLPGEGDLTLLIPVAFSNPMVQ